MLTVGSTSKSRFVIPQELKIKEKRNIKNLFFICLNCIIYKVAANAVYLFFWSSIFFPDSKIQGLEKYRIL